MSDLATLEGTIAITKGAAWAAGHITRWLKVRPKETPIFGMKWRFYDSEPTEGNAVGVARFERTWRRSVSGKWIRTRERMSPRDVSRPYTGTGFLRDRRLVDWFCLGLPKIGRILSVLSCL